MVYIVGMGTPDDPAALKLQTRRRRFINNVVRLEVHPSIMKERIRLIESTFPRLLPVSASAIYNCYGLVFAARRTAIVDEDDVLAILEDDGYRHLPWDASTWLVGDVVLYRNDKGSLAHVAMIAEKTPDLENGRFEIKVLSAWGESGEYLHPIDVVSPLLGKPAAVVSQRFLV